MSDWIDHDGRGAPDLPNTARVQAKFRDDKDPWLTEFGSNDPDGGLLFLRIRKYSLWTDNSDRNDPNTIVAYRVVSE